MQRDDRVQAGARAARVRHPRRHPVLHQGQVRPLSQAPTLPAPPQKISISSLPQCAQLESVRCPPLQQLNAEAEPGQSAGICAATSSPTSGTRPCCHTGAPARPLVRLASTLRSAATSGCHCLVYCHSSELTGARKLQAGTHSSSLRNSALNKTWRGRRAQQAAVQASTRAPGHSPTIQQRAPCSSRTRPTRGAPTSCTVCRATPPAAATLLQCAPTVSAACA